MTRKENILEILSKAETPLSTNQIVNIIYEDYHFIVDNKIKQYKEKNVLKTEKEIRQQIYAETSSIIFLNLKNEVVTKKINKRNHHILKNKTNIEFGYTPEKVIKPPLYKS